MEGSFSQDKFLALPAHNWRLSAEEAPVGPLSATGIHLVDLSIALLGRPTEVWARLATRGSPFANGDTLGVMIAFESGATAILSAILATPFIGRIALYGSQGWMEIRDRTHPEHPSGWDVTVSRRGGSQATHFVPPHPAVRDNIEAFARAIAGGAAYRSASRRLPPTCAPSRPSRAPRHRQDRARVVSFPRAQSASAGNQPRLAPVCFAAGYPLSASLGGYDEEAPDLTKSSLRGERELCYAVLWHRVARGEGDA